FARPPTASRPAESDFAMSVCAAIDFSRLAIRRWSGASAFSSSLRTSAARSAMNSSVSITADSYPLPHPLIIVLLFCLRVRHACDPDPQQRGVIPSPFVVRLTPPIVDCQLLRPPFARAQGGRQDHAQAGQRLFERSELLLAARRLHHHQVTHPCPPWLLAAPWWTPSPI